jgi:hypothetical protein
MGESHSFQLTDNLMYGKIIDYATKNYCNEEKKNHWVVLISANSKMTRNLMENIDWP